MILITPFQPRFELGSVYATANAVASFPGETLLACLNRHAAGDWGDLDEEDQEANRSALSSGDRLLSSYRLGEGKKLWVITEHDRSATTILLPEDY